MKFYIFWQNPLYVAAIPLCWNAREKNIYRNYTIHSRTMFSSFSLFNATIFQEQLPFKGDNSLNWPITSIHNLTGYKRRDYVLRATFFHFSLSCATIFQGRLSFRKAIYCVITVYLRLDFNVIRWQLAFSKMIWIFLWNWNIL